MFVPAMILHVAGGTLAMLAGGATLSVRKGGSLHAKAGSVFVIAMLVLTITGAAIAALKPDWGTAVIAVLTCYLVVTSWRTTQRKEGIAGRWEVALLLVAIACAIGFVSLGVHGLRLSHPRPNSLPPVVNFPFGAVAALAAALDLKFILLGVSPAQRIARHLWRMCAALLIAALSFFLGQQKVMPISIRGSPLLFLPPVAVLVSMVFWLLRVRFGKVFRSSLVKHAGLAKLESAQAPRAKRSTTAHRREGS